MGFSPVSCCSTQVWWFSPHCRGGRGYVLQGEIPLWGNANENTMCVLFHSNYIKKKWWYETWAKAEQSLESLIFKIYFTWLKGSCLEKSKTGYLYLHSSPPYPPLFSQKILHSLSHLKDHGWLPLILMLNPHQHFKTLWKCLRNCLLVAWKYRRQQPK